FQSRRLGHLRLLFFPPGQSLRHAPLAQGTFVDWVEFLRDPTRRELRGVGSRKGSTQPTSSYIIRLRGLSQHDVVSCNVGRSNYDFGSLASMLDSSMMICLMKTRGSTLSPLRKVA